MILLFIASKAEPMLFAVPLAEVSITIRCNEEEELKPVFCAGPGDALGGDDLYSVCIARKDATVVVYRDSYSSCVTYVKSLTEKVREALLQSCGESALFVGIETGPLLSGDEK